MAEDLKEEGGIWEPGNIVTGLPLTCDSWRAVWRKLEALAISSRAFDLDAVARCPLELDSLIPTRLWASDWSRYM